jgi:hypothetical protein
VAVIHPSPRCVLALMEGGNVGQDTRWRRGLRKYLNAIGLRFSFPLMPLWLAKEWEVHKHVRDPLWRSDLKPEAREILARRWVDAMADGGLTETEAITLIGERDRPHGSTSMELIDPSELPERYYREAWRRSSNGGPVWVDDNAAQAVDERMMWGRYEAKELTA